jgi:hypothetical protein
MVKGFFAYSLKSNSLRENVSVLQVLAEEIEDLSAPHS